MGLRHTAARVSSAAIAALVTTAGVGAHAAQASADTTAPTITDTGIAAGSVINGTVTVHPVVSDDVAVTKVELRHFHLTAATSTKAPFTLSWDSRRYSDVNVQLALVVYDAAGNSSMSEVVTVRADNHAPFVIFPWGSTYSLKQTPDISFTGVAPIDFTKRGVAEDTAGIELTIGTKVIGRITEAPWTIHWDTSGYNSKTRLTVRSWDKLGNTHTTDSDVWADHTGPTITPSFHWKPGLITGGSEVWATVSDGADVRRVELLVNGTAVSADAGTGGGPVKFTWPKGMPNGPATMTIRAEDMIGNVSEHTQTVTVDNDQPVATVSPAAGAFLRGTASPVAITGYQDPSGLAYFIAGVGQVQSSTNKAPWRVGVNTTWVRDGRHTLTWQIGDNAGNQTTGSRIVTVDNTAPAVTISKAPRNNSVLRNSTRISVTARDTYGIAKVQLLVNGKVVATDTTAAYGFTINPKKYGKKFTVRIRAYDKAGNVRYTAKRTYRR
ncbi:Ig-like domain-containing protein [Actinoplanes sp. NPDC023801]|uniref:Ig-like domain-containing protein n=1 Tax=Actinoplanes sp. NPDC023801 TaxID=3154595 RepID=UPI0034020794